MNRQSARHEIHRGAALSHLNAEMRGYGLFEVVNGAANPRKHAFAGRFPEEPGDLEHFPVGGNFQTQVICETESLMFARERLAAQSRLNTVGKPLKILYADLKLIIGRGIASLGKFVGASLFGRRIHGNGVF
jgi:hypothetical protein